MQKLLIVSDKNTAAIAELLRPFYERCVSAHSASSARRKAGEGDFDLAVINAPVAGASEAELALDFLEQGIANVILLLKPQGKELIERKLIDAPVFILDKPLSKELLVRTVRYMQNRDRREERIVRQNKKLRGKLDASRDIFRAKLLLMQNLSMSEDEAHKYLMRTAMDQQKTPEMAAKAIIGLYGS